MLLNINMLYQHIRVMLLLLFSKCSAPCGTGQRSQEVVHVNYTGEILPDEECSMSGPVMWKTLIWALFLTEWSSKVLKKIASTVNKP